MFLRTTHTVLITLSILLLQNNRLQAQKDAVEKEKLTNKEIVSRMNDLFNRNKPDSAMLFYNDTLQHAGNINGKSFLLAMHDDILATFPDVQTKILDMWEEGGWVIARCQFTGTHLGTASLPHHGGLLTGLAPTKKSFSVQHIRMYKLEKGKITARQAIRDDLAMYQQLGIVPTPPAFRPAK